MSVHTVRPIPDSYWVRPGQLLAGEYPGAPKDEEARQKLRQILDAGIDMFLDLTEIGEYALKAYAQLLTEEAAILGRNVEHRRISIPDMSTPTANIMTTILDTIDAALSANHIVYVHCFGGIGRTGTVIGCYLIRHGLSGAEALGQIAHMRQGTPDGWKRSPETSAQRQMVENWSIGR